jgi:hypothetical protein
MCDGRPPQSPDIRQRLGELRGPWNRNAPVVETGNFNGKPAMTNVGTTGSPRRDIPASEAPHIVERCTHAGAARNCMGATRAERAIRRESR